jgi:FkbM family methyltransferase
VALHFPSVFIPLLQGKEFGVKLHEKRVQKWKSAREQFRDHPKQVFGFKIYLNPDDLMPVSTSIGTSGVLDLPLTCLLRKVVKNGMTVVDIGANIGYYTLLASQLVGEGGRVIAFEPEALNFSLLEKSIRENEGASIRFYKLAVSDRNGQVRLYKGDVSQPGGHSIGTDRGHGFDLVESTTLDEFWESEGRPRIDLIKIHVSGDDPLVLKGGSKVLRDEWPMLTIVFDPPKWREEDESLLRYLFDSFEVYEVVESPFLLRRLRLSSLNRIRATELFLTPVGSRQT